MAGLGAPELLIVLAVMLLLFGGAKLPKLARSLGEAKKEMQAAQAEETTVIVGQPAPVALAAVTPQGDTVTMRVEDLEALLASKRG